jgi:hypothetical protein
MDVSQREDGPADLAGMFYADIFDRRAAIALKGMEQLSAEKQHFVCARTVEDDLRSDGPKLDRVEGNLRGIGSDLAMACLKTVRATAAQRR